MAHDKVIKALKISTRTVDDMCHANMRITFSIETDETQELRYRELIESGRNRADAISKVFAAAIEFVDREIAP
jgi:hypothetical protein